MEVFVDTSALYALYAAKDRNHAAARRTLAELRDRRSGLVTSTAVLLESYVLVHARTGRSGLLRFRDAIRRSRWMRTIEISPSLESEAWSLLEARTDKDYSFVDATSFAAMRLLAIESAFSFDEHFRQEGFAMLPAGGAP